MTTRKNDKNDLARLAHDLRNPLTLLTGYSDLLEKGLAGEKPDLARLRRQASAIRRAATAMDRLIEGELRGRPLSNL